jgi:hypothetical protein
LTKFIVRSQWRVKTQRTAKEMAPIPTSKRS